jgi:transposase
VYNCDGTDLANSFLLMLLTDLSKEADSPFYIDIRSYSNTEEDYLAFITAAIAASCLQKGDYLIADNASIHFGAATRTQLQELLAENDVTYLFLPTYSPELNPCELVFAYCKHYIRTHCCPTDQVHNLLLTALVALQRNHVVAYYEHCVYIQDRVVAQ